MFRLIYVSGYLRNGSKILLLNFLLVIKFRLALMKCPSYWGRHFIKFNDDINKIHTSVLLLGRYGFGCKKYAFHNQVTKKKFARVKLKKRSYLSLLFFQHPPAPLCIFHFLVPFPFLPSSLLVFFLFLIPVFIPLLLQCPDPQNCLANVLNMLRCVGNAK